MRSFGRVLAGLFGLALLVLLAQTGSFALLIGAVLYAFLTIRAEDASILDFLRFAARFLIWQQQSYEWEEPNE